MRKPTRAAALTLALALLCGCAPQGGTSSNAAIETPSQEDINASLTQTLMESVSLYELCCAGRSYNATDVSAPIGFAYGWLRSHDLLSNYEQILSESERVYAPDQPLMESLCALFFGIDIAPSGEEYQFTYGAEFEPQDGIALSCAAQEQSADNTVSLLVERSFNGQALYPARYVFAPAVLAEEPAAPIDAFYHKGDTVWQIRSVANLTRSGRPAAAATKEIHTVNDLLEMAKTVNGDSRPDSQFDYLLCADLDLAGVDFTPIGTNRRLFGWWDERDPTRDGFNAVFDGQGHTISNLAVTAREPSDPDTSLYTGMFAVIGEFGEVKNLALERCTVTSPAGWVPNASGMATGLLAGLCSGSIRNCRAAGTVTGFYSVGGLVGSIYGPEVDRPAAVERCIVDAAVTGHTEIGVFAGSIHEAAITDCAALGEVCAAASDDGSMPHAAGGFVGHSVEAAVSGCVSSCVVKTMVPSEWVGAFMAYNQGEIQNCLYDAEKAPGWEPVDVIYGGAGRTAGVSAVSSKEAARAIGELAIDKTR